MCKRKCSGRAKEQPLESSKKGLTGYSGVDAKGKSGKSLAPSVEYRRHGL